MSNLSRKADISSYYYQVYLTAVDDASLFADVLGSKVAAT
jgi:hypothetical protein